MFGKRKQQVKPIKENMERPYIERCNDIVVALNMMLGMNNIVAEKLILKDNATGEIRRYSDDGTSLLCIDDISREA